MPSLTLTPTTVEPSGNVRYDGAGFTFKRKVQVAIDGAGWSSNEFRPARDGTFHASFNVGPVEGTQTVSARYSNAPTVIVATATVTVKAVVTPPPDTKPTITDGPSATVTDTGATIGWSLSEPCTGQVEYGPTTAYGTLSTLETGLLSAHSQVLSGLTPGTVYHFRVHSKDSAGQEVVSSDTMFQTTGSVVPPPDPSTRPWPAPVTTRTVDVPTTIKADGSVDVSVDLNKFIKAQSDGTTIRFSPNATYRLDKGLLLERRTNLTLTGNARLLAYGVGGDEAASPFLLRGSNYIRIDPFRVDGGYTTYPGQSGEAKHVLGLSGWYGGPPSSYVEMHGVTGGNIQGDFVYLEGENVGAQAPSHHVWITDCDFSTCGRNGVSLINVAGPAVSPADLYPGVLIENNKFDRMAYHAIDFEPNFAAEETGRVTIRKNAFGEYAARHGLIGYFVQFFSPNAPAGYDISILDNTVAGIAADGVFGKPRTLHAKFLGTNKRLVNIRMEGNSTTRSTTEQKIAYFANVDGVIVKGNVAPGVTTFAQFDNCTGVVTS